MIALCQILPPEALFLRFKFSQKICLPLPDQIFAENLPFSCVQT